MFYASFTENQNVQENNSIICYVWACDQQGVCCRVSELYDLVTLQETRLFPWNLAVPSTLTIDVNSFTLSSIDVTNGIKAGRSNGGIKFIWQRDFGCNIQAKRYES